MRKQEPSFIDSKLTALLEPSLTGRVNCLFVSCMAPNDEGLMDNINTLNYADKLLTATKPKKQLVNESIFKSANEEEEEQEQNQENKQNLEELLRFKNMSIQEQIDNLRADERVKEVEKGFSFKELDDVKDKMPRLDLNTFSVVKDYGYGNIKR